MKDLLLWDVLPSVATYYLCRALGMPEYAALIAAVSVGFLRVLYVAIKKRRFDGFAAFTAFVFGMGLLLSLLSGDEKFLLAIKSLTTAAAGLILLGTCVTGRPAAFAIAKRFGAEDEATVQRWDALYAAEPPFRRIYVVMTVVWGTALLLESAVRLPLVYQLPTDVMAGLSWVLLIGTIALLGAWSAWYGKRGEARAARLAR